MVQPRRPAHRSSLAALACLPLWAQSSAAHASAEILFWLGVIVAAAMVLIVIGVMVRRLLTRQAETVEPGPVFSISDLRRMRDQGLITSEEYERARTRLIIQASAENPTSADQPALQEPSADGPEKPPADPPGS